MLGFGRRTPAAPRDDILLSEQRPDMVYVVGDIHGSLALLLDLEAQIADHRSRKAGTSRLVYLGDLIDRGPDSAGVIDHLLVNAEQPIVLSGNHEQMFLEFLASPHPRHPWLHNGGLETLGSYGLDAARLFENGKRGAQQRLQSHVPREHIDFLGSMPLCASWPGLTCVHAGLAAGVELSRQSSRDMTWLRMPEPAFTETQPFGLLVHGHTPSPGPIIEPYRICVDTGAFATGILTAACIDGENGVQFLQTTVRR
jgi:serine/threonine protein phosphatase 1